MNKTKIFRLGSGIQNIINLYGNKKLEYVIPQTMLITLTIRIYCHYYEKIDKKSTVKSSTINQIKWRGYKNC